MPQVKVANPAGSLMLVNGGSKMRKRRVSTARRHKKHNPRRRVSIKVNGKRHATRRRRRNPSPFAGTGILKDAFFVGIGAGGAIAVQNMINIQFGGALGNAAILAGIGYGLGLGVEKLAGREAGRMVALGGVSAAVTSLMNSYGLNIQNLISPKPVPAAKAGVGDIVALPRGAYDPFYGSSPNLSGMRDIARVAR